jgi:hypothetical protein
MLSEPLGVEKSTRVRPNVWPINSSISVIWKHEARATSHAPAEAFPIMSVYRKWTLPHGLCTTHTLSIAYRDHPVWRSRREEAKRGPPSGHRITRNGAAMVLLLLPYATTGLSRIAWWCVIGATPRGQPRMPVSYTVRRPFVGCPVPRELLRNALLDLTTIVPVTSYHCGSYAERYSRFMSLAHAV